MSRKTDVVEELDEAPRGAISTEAWETVHILRKALDAAGDADAAALDHAHDKFEKQVHLIADGTGSGELGLTETQLRICKALGCDPAVFARLAAQRRR